MAERTYAEDLAFLTKHTEVVELGAGGDGRVAVAPAYQGRVMTSTLAGKEDASFGWLNEEFIAAGKADPAFNNYGGEDRFWLGPEGGQFALWFKNGQPFESSCWVTPAGFDDGTWQLADRDEKSVSLKTRFDVASYSDTTFHCGVDRRIVALDAGQTAAALGAAMPDGARAVGFASENTLTNVGDGPWGRGGGLLSVWILGQFKPLPRGKVIVPFKPGPDAELGPRATLDYFGDLPAERGVLTDGHLLFACDGKFRSKIGISPARARNVLGSYDAGAKVLTIVQFNLPSGASELPYVNSLWEMQDKPFAGDVVNSYNDGEESPGAGQLGPFYELETSSPAAELGPGQAVTHVHRTCHFAGDADALNALSQKVLGVDLATVA